MAPRTTTTTTRSWRSDLGGSLPQIALPSLLGLFELERMSGELLLRHDDGRQARLYLREGAIVDAEMPGHTALPAGLADVLGWREGSFDFTLKPIARRDRLGMRTTVLLLDLARMADEAAAPTCQGRTTAAPRGL